MIGKVLEWWCRLRFREPRQLQLEQSPTVFDSSSSSSSSSSSLQQKPQVFLSFRGEDTRYNFTSHLHKSLKRKGIAHFIDYQLRRGEEISPALLTAIEESMISIIVLSENYASSSWCLDELCKILECKKRNGQMVLPIFYHVNPSDVRKQTGSFAKAFTEHDKKKSADKVEKWRAALVEVAGLAGDHLEVKKDRPEPQFIEEIVKEVSKKFMSTSSYDTEGLIGINSHIEIIESLLCFGSKDVRIIGIWGMGGIGKTTIADVVYNRFSAKFEGCCFLENVKGKYEQGHLRGELFSKILEDSNLNAITSSQHASLKHRLQHKKVLIVLDDVDNPEQLNLLPENCWFGDGSRIIVTSRDKQVLEQVVNHEMMYKVEELVDDEALQLFRLHAFKKSHPEGDFMELSKKVVHYAKGLPLALRVLGCHLYKRNKSFWKDELKKLEKIPNPTIDSRLRISYDGLDDEVKNIFLDIACFFKGNNRDYVEHMLKSCYLSVNAGIDILIDKSLITNELKMHDLLQQMGWNIVLQESKEPGKRSRLWTPNDIYHVLKNNTGTEMITGMFLDMSKSTPVCLSSTTFERMYKLQFLKFYYGDFGREREREMKVFLRQGDLESLPDDLRLLYWDDYPSKSLPSYFCPYNLVKLCMPNSRIEKLWNGVQNLVNLIWLDLSGSCHMIEIPDLSRATSIESINLDDCESLVEVPSSIGCLSKLKELDMNNCSRIEELPSSIEHLVRLENLGLSYLERLKNLPSGFSKLKSLQTLSLKGCSNFTKFPEIPGNLMSLNLSGTAIEQVPSSIECLSGLRLLYLENCTKLGSLPRNIFQLKCLYNLSISGFSEVKVIEERLGTVQVVSAIGTAKRSTIDKYTNAFFVNSCSGLVELPFDPENLNHLKMEECNLFTFPSHITCISSLTNLNLSGNSFETVPPSIGQLLNLYALDLSSCRSLQSLPASIKQLLKLLRLDLSYCERLQLLPPELPPFLEHFNLEYCERLQLLPKLSSYNLYLNARDCISLEAVSSSFPNCPMSCDHSYEFINCKNLDQNTIWAKTQLRIQQLATEDVKRYHKVPKEEFKPSSFVIYLPGSEIPEWFSCQNEGSSVTIPLPPHLHHHKFVGFPLCFVVAAKGLDYPFYVHCQCNFKNGDYHHKFDIQFVELNSFDTDHVIVYYNFKWYRNYRQFGYHPNEASFEFSTDGGVIKKCGVCTIYAQADLTEFPHGRSEECNTLMIQPSSSYDPMLEDGTMTKRTRDDYCKDEAEHSGNFRSDEEQEQHPKRFKL